MPSKKAKERKHTKKRLAKWCSIYGRTSTQIKNYRKKHGKTSVPSPPSY
jgi:hypothetical protein